MCVQRERRETLRRGRGDSAFYIYRPRDLMHGKNYFEKIPQVSGLTTKKSSGMATGLSWSCLFPRLSQPITQRPEHISTNAFFE